MENNQRRKGAVRVEPNPKRDAKIHRGAEHHRLKIGDKGRSYLRHNLEVAKQSYYSLLAQPLTTFMTLAVLAIALALPGALYAGLKNLQQLGDGWQGDPRIALYLKLTVTEESAETLSRELLLRDDVAGTELITAEQGMLEFQAMSGFGDVFSFLDSNPLPAVVMVMPRNLSVTEVPLLQAKLQALPQVDEAVVDMEWVQRLAAFVRLAERMVWVLTALFITAVLLVVGNTIRLSIESRRDEIIIAKLVGATDAYVRRPFLYDGVWFGVAGGLSAWVLIQLSLLLLSSPVEHLVTLYNSQFELAGLGFVETILLLIISILLGLCGAWLAVGRHLREIQPQ
ncbi:permease-like cell division protein FtsX [Amphritea sp. 2_MG-2023]|jgi:cell division transport system permease protein|uniref:permease-like cell division protein FtsX n=1 Tax=Amphritea TaxID=515417 RepID=UPI001C065AE4|nr:MULTISPECIES: permease-like cell division protein FtsX [Amphritea]MBU2964729.1 permease-like cell division protein FtsX [Amphritea atlantica]MDO6417126.1 permease-like cell division protein FtsX [Amphritea sp. 2_MG-2023]MDX2424483.1 permease-like cell division protein FtsX [Amphritea sp.]